MLYLWWVLLLGKEEQAEAMVLEESLDKREAGKAGVDFFFLRSLPFPPMMLPILEGDPRLVTEEGRDFVGEENPEERVVVVIVASLFESKG
jgi:hypothetical protein